MAGLIRQMADLNQPIEFSMEHTPHYGWSLGLRASTLAEMIPRVEKGFSITAMNRFAQRLELTQEELAAVVGISTRTLMRRKQTGRLEAGESDRLYRLVRLFERAVEILNSEAEARRWFRQPAWALGGATPISYVRTEPGAREVEALLERIEHGVLA